ncbi:MAG TPA: HAD family hydrolase [Spirochaetota bacterium]|nr:HAD family hydrolase [Spirochaetota bacterium]OPZ38172.1 MAG: 5'-nucleotidase [Spirochaetes bacterium ADurb.BinA120]HNU92287.1 HAD family hydrolase [Spirochaetota bacterium]HPI15166.1 HAD family hydrolase [Spirochaetota bacterium]HPO45280.1 HAD family hydrolase [Spirochaetota bacterium]
MEKAALFDIDGTILKCHGAGRLSLERACMEVFGTIGLMPEVNFQGKTDPLILYESLTSVGFERAEIDSRIDELEERYTEYLSGTIHEHEALLLPGIVDLLEKLSAIDGLFIGLLTGNFERGARIKLSRFGLNRYFTFGVFGGDTADRNEMPPIARRKIRGIFGVDIAFEDMIVIGDTVHDVECGRRSGARTMAVGTGWASREELLERNPDLYLDDLGDTAVVLAALAELLGLGPII